MSARTSTIRLGRRRIRTVVGACLIGVCGSVLIGCAEAQSTAVTDATNDGIAEPNDQVASPQSISLERFRNAVHSDGGPSPLTDETLQTLGDGICRQLAAGTDRSMIIENLRSVTYNGATGRIGQLQDVASSGNSSAASTNTADADHLASIIVDAAQADYC